MNKLLEFIDRLCLDEKLYWRVPMLAKSGTCEVQWRRDARPAAWSIREIGSEQWTNFSKGEMPRAIEQFQLDPFSFERQVGASILTQAVFADMVMEGAVDLFGQEAVRKSIADTRSFLSGVSDAAKRMTNTTAGKAMPQKNGKAMPQKNVTSKQPAAPKPGKPSLRLVAISWFLLAFAAVSTAPKAHAEAAGTTGHAVSTVEVDDVAQASFAQVLISSSPAATYLPFVGAGLAFETARSASYATQILAAETFRFAVAIGLVKNL